jgi:cellulose biosynthesis protein BcsQ
MQAFLASWLVQFAAAAGGLLSVAGLVGLGFRWGFRDRQRNLEGQVDQTEILLRAARNEVEDFRAEAILWRNRFNETARNEPSVFQRKLELVRSLISGGGSIWLSRPADESAIPKRILDGGRPVVTVANLKGGVGKTTVAMHLAHAMSRDRKVLLIDLDYQGSASTLLLRAAGREDIVFNGDRSRASSLIQRFVDAAFARTLPIPLGEFAPNLSVVPAYYPLADVEESMMLRWVIGDEPDDIRYNLAKALQSEAFDHDVVVIDAPPRLSTAMAQALAASTHILIPTQLERKSTEAALYFSATVRQFIDQGVNPNLILLGVVPNMVQKQTGYTARERVELKYLREEISPIFPDARVTWEETPIYDKVAFRRPNLVFFDADRGGQEASLAMNTLAVEVIRSVGVETRGIGN